MADNNDNKKKNDENDPFNFFKLAGGDSNKNDKDKNNKPKIPVWGIVLVVISVLALLNVYLSAKGDDTIEFSTFKKLIESGQITTVVLGQSYFIGYGPNAQISDAPSRLSPLLAAQSNTAVYRTASILTEDFLKFLDEKNVSYKAQAKQNNFFIDFLLNSILPIALLLLVWRFIFKKMSGGGGLGGSIFSAGQSRASAVEEGKVKTRFSDVAGVDEAKEELVEVVDFLKSPQKYTEIGGKIPKGVL
ncbi:MAG: ATP-dependent metallopeptidase FtsH/Yme1/Tma family protein, partial [Treponemataceae bacterium]